MSELKLLHFPSGNLRDVPDMLRRVAKNIEDGTFGEVTAAVLVTHAAPDTGEHRMDIFGFGAADSDRSVVLLHAASDLLIDVIVGRD